MKGRLQKAMPDVPLNKLRDPTEIHENGGIDQDTTAVNVNVQNNEENDVTFQCHEASNNVATKSKVSLLKRLQNLFERPWFGFKRSNVNNRALDASIEVDAEGNTRYGDNVDSDSENEGDFPEEIPLVGTRQNDMK